jgi:hypothetical protein
MFTDGTTFSPSDEALEQPKPGKHCKQWLMTFCNVGQVRRIDTFETLTSYAGHKVLDKYRRWLQVVELPNFNDSIAFGILKLRSYAVNSVHPRVHELLLYHYRLAEHLALSSSHNKFVRGIVVHFSFIS